MVSLFPRTLGIICNSHNAWEQVHTTSFRHFTAYFLDFSAGSQQAMQAISAANNSVFQTNVQQLLTRVGRNRFLSNDTYTDIGSLTKSNSLAERWGDSA